MAGEPSDVGLEAALQPQMSVTRRRRFTKSRRRRMDHLLPRMGLTALMGAVLVTFASDSASWGLDIWERSLGGSADGLPAALSPFHHDARLLQTVSPSPAAPPPSPPAPCAPDTVVANSTYPEFAVKGAGGTVLQFFIMFYMFLGLAIVCDSFFEAALSRICEAMNLKDDVAGATWMAAGGSAPELATSVLGVFVSDSDVGFGTIVGSAVFNVLFVIACCAFVAPNLKLTWWPLARDCAYYCFSMSILVFCISDLKIQAWEATVLLLLYAVYVTVMYYNERLEEWVSGRIKLCEMEGNSAQKMLRGLFSNFAFQLMLYGIIFANAVVVIFEIIDDGDRANKLPCYCGDRVGEGDLPWSEWSWINFGFNLIFICEMLVKWYAFGFFGYWRIPLNCFDGSLVFLILVEFILTTVARADGIGIGVARSLRVLRFIRAARMLRLIRVVRAVAPKDSRPSDNQVVPAEGWHKDRDGADANGKKEEEPEDEEDDDDDEPFNPLEVPDGIISKFFFVVGLPLSVAMWLTIPDCRREVFKSFWFGTFAMAIVWIGGLSFVMVWMVTEFGIDYGIRDSIMGITLLAMGTSIPDCLSSIAVARRGHGDMAVSSSIGSNIFDILIGLPLPWLLYTAVLQPAGAKSGPSYVNIYSESLAVMILSLFVMVALVITTIHISGWVLSIKLGAMMMLLYFIFLMLSLLLEFDVILGPCGS